MRVVSVLMIALLCQACVSPVVAGAGAGALLTASERRSAGTLIEDDTIESKGEKRVEEKYKDAVHVDITAFNRFALITGTVKDEASKMDIERIVGAIPNVKGIANELVVAPAYGTHSADSRITASVKQRFVKNPAFKADHVKVITENGVVYLMGLVTRAEANAASEIAATTKDVQRVVRVFEYID